MNLVFVGGTCGIIDFFILGFNFILLDKMNDFSKNIREKLESYNELQKVYDYLEITQRNININEELQFKPKNLGNHNNLNNLKVIESEAYYRDKNNSLINILKVQILKIRKIFFWQKILQKTEI